MGAATLRIPCKYSEGLGHTFLPTGGLNSACKDRKKFHGSCPLRGRIESRTNQTLIATHCRCMRGMRGF